MNTHNGKVSVVIPSRGEKYLQATIDDLLKKASGEIEIIAVLDGYWPNPPLKEDKRVVTIHRTVSIGLRQCVNLAVAVATGDFILKTDAHCLFMQDFDKHLKACCDDRYLVISRRVSLDPIKWEVAYTGKPPVDYEFITYPFYFDELGANEPSVRTGNIWNTRTHALKHVKIDDDMSFQGSCWFMRRSFFNYLGPLNSRYWGTFVLEPEELGNKVWLSGGRVIVNKNVFYAHWHKGKENGRGYFIDRRDLNRGRAFHKNFWIFDGWLPEWPKQERTFEWMIDHFWPVPTWPADWKEKRDGYAKLRAQQA